MNFFLNKIFYFINLIILKEKMNKYVIYIYFFLIIFIKKYLVFLFKK